VKITKSQLKRIIREERQKKLVREARMAPDANWWSLAFNGVIEDQIGYGEPTPEQRAAILAGLQKVLEEL
jgi:hypothetical protein